MKIQVLDEACGVGVRNVIFQKAKPIMIGAALTAAVISTAFAKQPISATDLFGIAYAMNPALSPDGKTVAYLKEWMDPKADIYRSQLWLSDFAGKSQRAASGEADDVAEPRWSPDGRGLAFVARSDVTDEAPQIYVLSPADGTRRRIGTLPANPSRVAWSPDGARIAFVMKVSAPAPTLGTVEKSPEGANWQPQPFITERLRFRFDGAGLIGNETHDVFVATVATGEVRRLTHGEALFGGPLGVAGSLSWSPDGRFLVTSAHTAHEADYTPRESDVYSVDTQSGAVQQLTSLPGGEARGAISPDGRWLAFLRTERSPLNHQDPRLAVVPVGGGTMKILSAPLDRPVSGLQWSADSRAVFASYDDRGISRLARFGLDGRIQPIAEKLGSWALAYVWGAGFSVAPNGAFVITTADERTPGDIAAGKVGKPGTHRITRLSEDFLSTRAPSTMETFTLKVENAEIAGWLVKPPGFDPTRKYPLILSIHGGPHLYFGPRWDYRHEVMAGKGYVVAYINPRGSTGYGEAFAQATDKAFPGVDYPEFEAAADYLAALAFVDKDRMYVTGGSGGGTLTAHIIGRTGRYRAAASEYPVVDYTSWSLLSDNPAIYTQHWAGGFPWTNGAHYTSISPLSLVGNVKTPTLLVCSEEDWRTPINQCEMYYTALKLRGIEAALVRYPDEAHEIQGYPSNRVSEINILLGWFARHGGPQ